MINRLITAGSLVERPRPASRGYIRAFLGALGIGLVGYLALLALP